MSVENRESTMHFTKKQIGSKALLGAVVVLVLSLPAAAEAIEKMGLPKGICVVLGLPRADRPDSVTNLAAGGEMLVYFQSPDAEDVLAVRQAAEAAGLLGTRVFADRGSWTRIHLGDNLAGAILVGPSARDKVSRRELLRVLHPEGKATLGDEQIVKPFPAGIDAWSHPQHGPNNNPLSNDKLARAPYRTQFLAEPMFCPMPIVTVAAAGRTFKAFGHITSRADQNPYVHTLLGINGYNGAILWRRKLKPGFMMYRNTMIATPEVLYLGDDESCKRIDARTGEVRDEIVIDPGISDGPVWKWMALQSNVLYALVGGQEVKTRLSVSDRSGMGHWSWKLPGEMVYKDPKTNFGFGRTMVAIDPIARKILWHHRETEHIDSRAVCMVGSRIYFYIPHKRLSCLDAETGKIVWQTSDADLLKAIGPDIEQQHPHTGFSPQIYMYSNDKYVFFAGPQRKGVIAVSAADGKFLWRSTDCVGMNHLILLPDALCSVTTYDKLGSGPRSGLRDYATGKLIGKLPTRWNCVRVTASTDSLFGRGAWGAGTWRYDVSSRKTEFISPMRPGCQDGVIVSNGLLYWGPWLCGACNISLYGHICLAPAGQGSPAEGDTLDASELAVAKPLEAQPSDWPCFRGDNQRSGITRVAIGAKATRRWMFKPPQAATPTAPITAGGLVFVADRAGVVRALDAGDGRPRWKAYTGGAVHYPPAFWNGRLYVGSADGRVYAYEAATGRLLWRFRAAPTERHIPVYGDLASTWPVAGGLVVDGGTVYAAAGITDYDGTHVYALDAMTGKVRWHNDSTGMLSKRAACGISLQGPLYLDGGKLCFQGGTVYKTAEFDLKTGKCLTKPVARARATSRTAFAPYFGRFAGVSPVRCELPDGKLLAANSWNVGVGLFGPALPDAPKTPRPRGPNRKTLWQKRRWTVQAVVVAGDSVLAAARTNTSRGGKSVLAALKLADGSDLWQHPLEAQAARDGIAVDHQGRILVSLADGRVLCLAGR